MDPFWLGILGTVAVLLLIILRVPIALALTGIGTLGLIVIYGLEPASIYPLRTGQQIWFKNTGL